MKNEVISKFKEKPKTKTAWWAMGLGLATILVVQVLLSIFAAVIRPMIDKASNENIGATIGFSVMIFALVLSVSALVAGILAYRKGERSWVLWAGFVPAILTGAFWIIMIFGEFLFPH